MHYWRKTLASVFGLMWTIKKLSSRPYCTRHARYCLPVGPLLEKITDTDKLPEEMFASVANRSKLISAVKTTKRFVSLQFLNGRQPVGPLDVGSARRKAATYAGKDKHRINVNIHALSGIRTNDPSVLAGDDTSCLDLAATVIGLRISTILAFWRGEIAYFLEGSRSSPTRTRGRNSTKGFYSKSFSSDELKREAFLMP
jgi:hypothetical protein